MINELVKKENITEELKAKNQLAWVVAMNSIKSIAEEIIYNSFFYTNFAYNMIIFLNRKFLIISN